MPEYPEAPRLVKEIYLIRHAQTEYNRLGMVQGSGIDAPLNEEGQRQAEAFYRSYRHIGFDKVYVSKLQRTRQTVAGFIEDGTPVEAHAGLNEISWGNYEGQSVTRTDNNHYEETIQAWRSGRLDIPIGNGETPLQVAARQKPVLDLIFSRPEEKRILICMHGRAMRIFLCGMLNKPLERMDEFLHHNTGLYHIKFYADGAFQFERENCLLHLDLK